MLNEFEGFPAEGRQFLADLSRNNQRDWFQDHKKDYEKLVKRPAEALRDTLCDVLATELGQDVQGKIFRINRDLRFSKDKTPYNTHVRMLFWSPDNSDGTKETLGGVFMISIEAETLVCGTGNMSFTKEQLSAYRERLSEPGAANELHALLEDLRQQGFRTSDRELVKPPPGTDKSHPHPELLQHKSLCIWHDLSAPKGLATRQADQVILAEFQRLWPLYAWLKRPQ